MSDEDGARLSSGTWHYGLIARWWAEVNRPEVAEIAYLRAAIARFGEPALDLVAASCARTTCPADSARCSTRPASPT